MQALASSTRRKKKSKAENKMSKMGVLVSTAKKSLYDQGNLESFLEAYSSRGLGSLTVMAGSVGGSSS